MADWLSACALRAGLGGQAILDFGTIHWTFLWGILISKSLVFVCAIVGTLLLDHKNSLGNAGLRGKARW